MLQTISIASDADYSFRSDRSGGEGEGGRPAISWWLRQAKAARPGFLRLFGGRRERRPQRLHELDQVGLPQLGVEMAEMPVRVWSGRDQHIAAVLDPLHRALDGAELGRVRMVLGVIDEQHLGLDFVEI